MDIIKLVDNGNGDSTLYQWDTDRQIMISPEANVTVDEVHFSNQLTKEALVVIPTVDADLGCMVANIPNILLQRFMCINVYVVMYTENGERTTYSDKLQVIQRQKPEDYVYTETEVFDYKSLEARIEELEKGGGGGGITEETDPTVSDWAKEPEKPTYTAQEVGALPNTTKLADLEQDANNRLVTDEEKELWNGKSDFSGDYNDLDNKPTFPVQSVNGKTGDVELNATDVGAYGSGAGVALETLVEENTNDISKLSEEKISTPSTGSVDQILAVKTVDASGKPTEFECVDKPATPEIPTALKNPYSLKFTGAVTKNYDGSEEVSVNIPQSYTLPIATAETLGGVKPVAKTDAMTQSVGVDANGALYTESGLPSVSTADNDKFLRVVNGVWAAVTVANAEGVSF